ACLTTAFCLLGQPAFFRARELGLERGSSEAGPVAGFDDVFPSVAYFRDRIEAENAALAADGETWKLVSVGLPPALELRLAQEAPWARVEAATVGGAAAPAAGAADAGEILAVAGALRGRFA
ncbi:MAG: hypothetical protein ACRD1E_02450, partial [Terriglobales bacterium]